MSLKTKSAEEVVGAPFLKRRRSLYRSISRLTVGEENVNLKMTVVSMEDVFSFDKKNKIRNLIVSDESESQSFVHLSAWNISRDLFASSTFTTFMNSSSLANSLAFNNLLGKTVLLKNVSVTPPPPAAYNYGNVQFAISFKPSSVIEIVKTEDEMIPSKVKLYVKFLAETRFFLNDDSRSFAPLTNALLKDNSYIDAELSVIGIDDLRFICNDGVLQSVLDITCSRGKIQLKLTAWNMLALFLHNFLSNSHGALIRVEHVRVYRSNSLLFVNSSKISLVKIKAGIFTPNSLSQFAGLFGAVKVSLRLFLLTDMCPTGSNHGLFVGTATDGIHKCQIYTQHQPTFKSDDEIFVSKVSIQWNGNLLAVTVISDEDVKVFSDEEDFKIVDVKEIDDLNYPENST